VSDDGSVTIGVADIKNNAITGTRTNKQRMRRKVRMMEKSE
jgi:hypothetical protein